MKTRILLLSMVFGLTLLLQSNRQKGSAGAPPGHTGAPNEQSCARVGCHDDHPANAGTARTHLAIEGLADTYFADQVYTLKVAVYDQQVKSFGFQLIALNESGEQAGTFIISDPQRTQLVEGYQSGIASRTYATYTYYGTDAIHPDSTEWTLKWRAPKAHTGPLTFYLATVSTNHDGTDKGDFTFTRQYRFEEDPLSSLAPVQSIPSDIRAWASKTPGTFTLVHAQECELTVYDLSGSAHPITRTAHSETEELIQIGAFKTGIYLVQCTTAGGHPSTLKLQMP